VSARARFIQEVDLQLHCQPLLLRMEAFTNLLPRPYTELARRRVTLGVETSKTAVRRVAFAAHANNQVSTITAGKHDTLVVIQIQAVDGARFQTRASSREGLTAIPWPSNLQTARTAPETLKTKPAMHLARRRRRGTAERFILDIF